MKYQLRVKTFDAMLFDGSPNSAAAIAAQFGATSFQYSAVPQSATFTINGDTPSTVTVATSEYVYMSTEGLAVMDGATFNQQYVTSE